MRSRGGFWTRRTTASIVIVATLLWFVIAWETPPDVYGRTIWPSEEFVSGIYNYTAPQQPAVTYHANFTFSAVMDFSVGTDNPILFKALIYDAIPANFSEYYVGMVFGYEVLQARGNVPTLPIAQHFKSEGNGVWEVNGMMSFDQKINFTGPVLVPAGLLEGGDSAINWTALYASVSGQVKTYNFPLMLQPQSFTSQLPTYEANAKLLVSLASIGLPVIYGVLVRVTSNKEE
jgi:hypothetical protein